MACRWGWCDGGREGVWGVSTECGCVRHAEGVCVMPAEGVCVLPVEGVCVMPTEGVRLFFFEGACVLCILALGG